MESCEARDLKEFTGKIDYAMNFTGYVGKISRAFQRENVGESQKKTGITERILKITWLKALKRSFRTITLVNGD
jgi:hypothetical protein